jgi:hypothetical protein
MSQSNTKSPEYITCDICAEDIKGNRARKLVNCVYCQGSACRTCWETYFLDTKTIGCMYPSCQKTWSYKSLHDNFTHTFINSKIKKIREDKYFEQEKALFPATQDLVKNAINHDKRNDINKHYMDKYTVIRDNYYKHKLELMEHFGIRYPYTGGYILTTSEPDSKHVNLVTEDALYQIWKDEGKAEWGDLDLYTSNKIPISDILDNDAIDMMNLLFVKQHTRSCKGMRVNRPEYKCPIDTDGNVSHFIACVIMLIYHTAENHLFEFITPNTKIWDNRILYRIYKKKYNEINRQYWDESRKLKDIRNEELSHIPTETQDLNRNNKQRFIRSCPESECKGFLNNNWKCGLCENRVCSYCHVSLGCDKDIDHECDPAAVETAKLITSESKPCPGCHINITKIDGCDQMWCTQCKTAWDWKTGQIEKRVHNPHYFEYLRSGGNELAAARDPNEIRCGREVDEFFVNSLVTIMKDKGIENDMGGLGDALVSTLRSCMHIANIIRKFDAPEPNTEYPRVLYMRGKIKIDEFKRRIQMMHKKYHKNKEIYNILAMVNTSTTEILYRFRERLEQWQNKQINQIDWQDCWIIMNEFTPLTEYANDCLLSISSVFKSIPLKITYDELLKDKDEPLLGLYNCNTMKPIR